MPDPQFVNPSNFTQTRVLYNHDGFSIVFGTWNEDGDLKVAMRWNGEGEDQGYPKLFGHPQWFIIHPDIAENILVGLLANNLLTDEEFANIRLSLREFRNRT